jgi:hypothetical protein
MHAMARVLAFTIAACFGSWPPLPPKQCQTRVEQYRSALDRAVLVVAR